LPKFVQPAEEVAIPLPRGGSREVGDSAASLGPLYGRPYSGNSFIDGAPRASVDDDRCPASRKIMGGGEADTACGTSDDRGLA
jgi:hypothetical protein